MKILTADQLRRIDRLSGDTLTLMENAGRRVVEAIEERFERPDKLKVCILCGKGNNGGDGLVVARLLIEKGCVPHVLLFAGEETLTGDAATNLARLKALDYAPFVVTSEDEWDGHECDGDTGLVVDALLGTGLTRQAEGLYKAVIQSVPDRFPDAVILSVDVPSGLSADTGEIPGAAIQADFTATFTALKHCLVFPPAHRLAGDIVVADIGNPPELLNAAEHNLSLITPEAFPRALHRRAQDTHKGDYGKVLVIGGSRGKSGAAAMAGQAALRSGAGLVTVATSAGCLPIVAASMPELMTEPLEETASGGIANGSLGALLEGKTILALGPGIGTHPETQEFARGVVRDAVVPIVLDADGLNAFVGYAAALRGNARRPLVITPHPGEMARLTGRDTASLNANRIQVAREFAGQHEAFVVLKGFRTIVAFPDASVYVNATGNPGMATGGMGDILTGMIAGMLAQESLGTFEERLLLAVHLHGLAGDLAAEEVGEEPLVATDLLYYLGAAWEQIRE